MITRENEIEVQTVDEEEILCYKGSTDLYKKALFFDLEHYVYKKPVCVGVFGCCYYDEKTSSLKILQNMIENQEDSKKILTMSLKYFKEAEEKGKKYIVTFSGNNDFTVINYLFSKANMDYKIEEHFESIDLQKEYEKIKSKSIGLKNLEKEVGIIRDSELISGSNLAKTFHKIMKDKDYCHRMPEEKINKILLYNEQDVINLFHIYTSWYKVEELIEEK